MAIVEIESADTTSAPVISVRFTSHLLLLSKKAELANYGMVPRSAFPADGPARNKVAVQRLTCIKIDEGR
jgi:hypothetical protein